MANTKKKVTVPKPKTVSMRKYSELKTKYDALNDAHDGAKKKINEQAVLILKQAEEIHNLQPKKQDCELKSGMPGLGPIVNQEFIVLDKIVNEVARLNPFQRRTVVAGFLSSLKERMKYEAKERASRATEAYINHQYAQEGVREQESGMASMAKIFEDFSN